MMSEISVYLRILTGFSAFAAAESVTDTGLPEKKSAGVLAGETWKILGSMLRLTGISRPRVGAGPMRYL